MQTKYIMKFQEKMPWIFSNDIEKQIFSKDDIIKMKKAKINVNRIVAYKFEFPLKCLLKVY